MLKFLVGLIIGAVFDDYVLAGLVWLLEYLRGVVAG